MKPCMARMLEGFRIPSLSLHQVRYWAIITKKHESQSIVWSQLWVSCAGGFNEESVLKGPGLHSGQSGSRCGEKDRGIRSKRS